MSHIGATTISRMQFYRKALSRSAKIPESTFSDRPFSSKSIFCFFGKCDTGKRSLTAKILIAKYFTWVKIKAVAYHSSSFEGRFRPESLFSPYLTEPKLKPLSIFFHFRRNVFCLCSSTPTSATMRPRRCARSCRTTSTTSKNFTRSFFGTR